MVDTINVGQSKVNTWRNCKQAYTFKYVEEIQRKRTRRPFVFGKIIHRMIEEDANKGDPFSVLDEAAVLDEKMFTSEREMYGEIIEDIRTIMADYFTYWKERGDTLRFLAVEDPATGVLRRAEHEFAVPLYAITGDTRDEGITFKGQIDGLGKTANKLRWLIENKSFDSLPSDDHRWRNIQYVVYSKAAIALGWIDTIDGVCWNYVMSKPPTIPQVLKDGTRLSVREVITLPSVVRRALAEHKLDASLESHVKLLADAEQNRSRYFQRIYNPLNTTTVDNIFSGFVDSAREMREYHGLKKDKNLGRHCEWCDYETICRAELTGGDVDYVKQVEFVPEDSEAYRRSGREKLVTIKKKAK